MTLPVPLDPAALATLATGRDQSLFADDLAACSPRIREAVHGRRVLVIGGAGSIGSATVRALLPFGPAHLHVVDRDENSLAELVRDLRSGRKALGPELRTLPLDYGAPVMRRFLGDEPPYDLVLNFAALKHVRSERDVYSLTQLLETNVLRQERFLGWMAERGSAVRYFCVSTDKAANPASLMGASKRVMEHVMFSGLRPIPAGSVLTSARFANVAFSAGSLLESFLRRIARRQPLAVPAGTRRYFVSLEEAGQICLIAATAVPGHHIVVPRLGEVDLRLLEEIAAGIIEWSGWTPLFVDGEDAARAAMERFPSTRRYPISVTALDTSGEKPTEEFFGEGESEVDVGLSRIAAIPYTGGRTQDVREFLGELQALVAGEHRATKAEVVEWMRRALGNFDHVETGRHLDGRM